MNRIIPLIAFSVLLLVPVGAQQVFANHPNLPCPPHGVLESEFGPTAGVSQAFFSPYCFAGFNITCPPGYITDLIFGIPGVSNIPDACTAAPGSFPDPTLAAQCQGAAVLLNNHCFAQALASMVGGWYFDIDTPALLVASIGTNPVITALIGITLAGVAGQAAWFIHRRKKKNSS